MLLAAVIDAQGPKPRPSSSCNSSALYRVLHPALSAELDPDGVLDWERLSRDHDRLKCDPDGTLRHLDLKDTDIRGTVTGSWAHLLPGLKTLDLR